MLKVGVVTDDFTGAASSGMMMAKYNVNTYLLNDRSMLAKLADLEDVEAIYVSSNSRNLNAKEAYNEVKLTTESLISLSPQYVSKKIDTTMRGGIGYEIDAMLDVLGEEYVAIFVSAMPQSRRICVGGYSIIDNVILTETPVAKDVRSPVKESHIPTLIQSQTKHKVSHVSLGHVLKGTSHLSEVLITLRNKDSKIIVIDSITLEHLKVVAKSCIDLGWKVLAVDPGPFTVALAKANGVTRNEKIPKSLKDIRYGDSKTALIISGSANPFTRKQIEYLCENESCIRITADVGRFVGDKKTATEEVENVFSQAISVLSREVLPKSLIVDSLADNEVLDLAYEDRKRGYKANTSSSLINKNIAIIAGKIMEEYANSKIAGLMVTGGDTLTAVSKEIDLISIKADDSIVAQIDVGKINGKYENMPIIVKGGFCGDEKIFTDIVKRLHLESQI